MAWNQIASLKGPPGGGSATVVAAEALSAGQWISLLSGAARVADSSDVAKEADGYVLADVAAGGSAEVFTSGVNTAVVGQQLGAVFLSSAGAGSASVGAGAAYAQRIGTAIRPDAVVFSRGHAVGL